MKTGSNVDAAVAQSHVGPPSQTVKSSLPWLRKGTNQNFFGKSMQSSSTQQTLSRKSKQLFEQHCKAG
jgi:hypothetical protein